MQQQTAYSNTILFTQGKPQAETLNLSCNASQIEMIDTPIEDEINDPPPIAKMYALSYMYLGTFAFIGCLVVGILVSLVTPRDKELKPETIRNVFSFTSPRFQSFITCGVHPESYEDSNHDREKDFKRESKVNPVFNEEDSETTSEL